MDVRRALYCFVLILACVSAQSPDSKKTKKSTKKGIEGKIIGGEAVAIEQMQYTCSIGSGYGTISKKHFCGGTIVHSQYVLTAAHCVTGQRLGSLFVRTGSTNSDRSGQETLVRKIIIHPNYNTRTVDYDAAILRTDPLKQGGVNSKKMRPAFDNDAAILELLCPVTLNNRARIAYMDLDKVPQPGSFGVVSGWGVVTPDGSRPSRVLRAVLLPVLDKATCARAYPNKITNSMMCAGYKDGKKDACQGDSGGPIVIAGKLAGIVSWGKGCAEPGAPGVFTALTAIKGWILDNIPPLPY